jgi:quercetin dioxygenase-like cupin family protein
MSEPSFESFRAQALAQGFDEVLVREWAPDQVVATHTHPFSVQALVVSGGFELRCEDHTRQLRAGDRFELAAGVPHAEHYGPEGAIYWAARRNGAA